MLKILINYYKNMLKQNILLLFMYFNVFMIIFFSISEEYSNVVDKQNIFTTYPSNACYVSDPFKESERVNEQDFINRITEHNLNMSVGFEIINTRKRTSEGEQVLVYMNNYLMEFCYPIKHGRWFCNNEYDGVVIGGSLSKEYDVGDSILLYTEGNYDKVKIIGDLGINYQFMFLNRLSDELNYGKILTKSNDGIIITNCMEFLDKNNMILSTNALVIDKNNIQLASILGINTEKSVLISDMCNVNTQSNLVILENRIMFTLILLAVIFCITYEISLYSLKSRKILCLLWKQGMNYYQLAVILMVPQIINIMLAYTLQLFYRVAVNSDSMNTILITIKVMFLIINFILVYTFFMSKAFIKKLCSKPAN